MHEVVGVNCSLTIKKTIIDELLRSSRGLCLKKGRQSLESIYSEEDTRGRHHYHSLPESIEELLSMSIRRRDRRQH